MKVSSNSPAPPTAEIPLAVADDSLRIQAAAVAAQQAKMIEYEIRLEQRATALNRQEEQLAAHLEHRRKELDEREQAGAAIPEQRRHLERERKRLSLFRRRLVTRFREKSTKREAHLKARESALEAQAQQQQSEQDRLRDWFTKAKDELEQRKRQASEQARESAREQERAQDCIARERAARDAQIRESTQKLAEAAAARDSLTRERNQWEEYHARLTRETKSLEARIAAQKQQLAGLSCPHDADIGTAGDTPKKDDSVADADRQDSSLAVPPVVDPASSAQLLKQWQQLLRLHDAWQTEHHQTQQELEQIAQGLLVRETAVAEAERIIALGQAENQRRADELTQEQMAMEARRIRLTMLQAAATTQHAAQTQWIEERRAIEQRRQHYQRVHERRNAVRREEILRLRELFRRIDGIRRAYHDSLRIYEPFRAELEQQQRILACRELAIEQARQELLGHSGNRSQVESAIERYNREAAERMNAMTHDLERERKLLVEERARLTKHAETLATIEARATLRLDEKVSAHTAEDANLQRHQDQDNLEELRRLKLQKQLVERELQNLREELERVAVAFTTDIRPPYHRH